MRITISGTLSKVARQKAARPGCITVYQINRRRLLGSSAILLLMNSTATRASVIKGALPWKPGAADPPDVVSAGGWKYFASQEGATIEAFVDRLIPADNLSPGGKDCGCAVYIDRQLAGPMGVLKAGT